MVQWDWGFNYKIRCPTHILHSHYNGKTKGFYRLKTLFWLSSTLLTTLGLIYHLLPFPLPSENGNKMTDEVSQCTKAKYAT